MNNRQIAPGTLVIALPALASIAHPVSAQSSVTLFGIADLAARSVHNEGTAAMNLARSAIRQPMGA
jgi:hypothetical protein